MADPLAFASKKSSKSFVAQKVMSTDCTNDAFCSDVQMAAASRTGSDLK